MKSALVFLLSLLTASAFVIQPAVQKYGSSMSMIMPDAAPAAMHVPSSNGPSVIVISQSPNNYLEQQKASSFNQFLTPSSSVESSTNLVSLKERPPPPTAEEIAQKKKNFNLWFWGGGFVAPFLATFYYFGLKFWEK
mmetsp:Transcript_3563/g.4710  ORF Transcript_3563/g.4710 Transcript_3563/m.4710 type:complete len:137 (-) Transcript_3563:332-742(-)